ncbi:MAG: 4Fe-4S binding protein [Anaerolineae bacterium]|nr:4Fe-4S binding protein [Anaerolineae bacterium]
MVDAVPVIQITLAEDSNKRKKPRGQVVLFGSWCKGCGLCVEFCPTGVLALDENDHPIVIKPENCTGCHWCDTHCPDMAIVVKRLD